MLSPCIQTNSLLFLSELDLGTSFGNLMYSSKCMVIFGIHLIIVAMKMSCHLGIIFVFNAKNMTLESVNDSVSSLFYIFNVASVAF